jgi:uncharacterized membrane protein YqiK
MLDWDWGTILGGGSFVGFLTLVCRDLIRGAFGRRKNDAEADALEANREVTLSQATLQAMRELSDSYESRLRAVQADAQAQIAGTRADAANSVAQAMHEVSTARGEASAARSEAAEARRVAERIEQLLLWVRAVIWTPGPDGDPRVTRIREHLGDGTVPLSSLVNGSPR